MPTKVLPAMLMLIAIATALLPTQGRSEGPDSFFPSGISLSFLVSFPNEFCLYTLPE
jgi:hypothetical protein